jgi:hypothetical protein
MVTSGGPCAGWGTGSIGNPPTSTLPASFARAADTTEREDGSSSSIRDGYGWSLLVQPGTRTKEGETPMKGHLTPTQREFIDGLRDIADWFEDHPHYITISFGQDFYLSCVGDDAAAKLVALSRELGKVDKSAVGAIYEIARKFGPHKISGNASRGSVCEKIVTKTTKVVVVPDPVLLAAVPTVSQTEEVEEVEWKCPDSLLAIGSSTASGESPF